MAKETKKSKGKHILTNDEKRRAYNVAWNRVSNQTNNTTTTIRSRALSTLLNPGLDIDYECRYPTDVTLDDFKRMFDREGLAQRVVNIYPEECWAMTPEIVENEEAEGTEFEKEWKALEKERHVLQYLQRIDILSGIGDFGILLLGLNDGGELKDPVPGINEDTGEKVGKSDYKLLFLKPLDETVVKIKTKENKVSSPRFGLPVTYEVIFEDVTTSGNIQTKIVHWTRILHIADGRQTSDIVGTPRMKAVYNRLLDVRKVVSGSAEMFWRGGYPGTFFKIDDEVAGAWDADAEKTFEEQVKSYAEGMQRYLAMSGVEAEPMQPQIADPKSHLDVQVDFIAMSIAVPKRIFTGSERGELASSQDAETWNKRVDKRRKQYITPMIIRLFVDRMIVYGVLPEVEEYEVKWPDLDAPSDKDQAEVSKVITESFAKYVQGDVDQLIAPAEFLKIIFGMTDDEIQTIAEGVVERVGDTLGQDDTTDVVVD